MNTIHQHLQKNTFSLTLTLGVFFILLLQNAASQPITEVSLSQIQQEAYLPTRAVVPQIQDLPHLMEAAYEKGMYYDSYRWATATKAHYSTPLGIFGQARSEAALGYYKKALKRLEEGTFINTAAAQAHMLRGKLTLILAEMAQLNGHTKESEAYLRTFFQNHDRSHPRYAYLMAEQARLQRQLENTPTSGPTDKPIDGLTDRPLRIGVLLPLSGPIAKIGQSMEKALTLKLFEAQTPVELYIEDTQGTPQGTQEAFNRLIQADVKLALGPILSQNTQKIAPQAAQEGIPLIAYSSDIRAQQDPNTYLFSMLPTRQAKHIARYSVDKLGLRVFAALAPNTTYGKNMLNAFKEELNLLGATLEGEAFFDPKNPDLRQPLRKLTHVVEAENALKAERAELEEVYNLLGSAMDDADLTKLKELRKAEAQPIVRYQALFIPAPAKDMPLIASQLAFYDSDGAKVQLLGTSQWAEASLLKEGKAYLKNSLYPTIVTKAQKTFNTAYMAAFNTTPHPLAALAYDSLTLITQLNNQGFDKSRNFKTYLQNLRQYTGTTGPYSLVNNKTWHNYGINKLQFRRGRLRAKTTQEPIFTALSAKETPTFYPEEKPKKRKKPSFWQGIFGN